MIVLTPQYIKDASGENSLVVLPAEQYQAMLEELEELEVLRIYDDAKKEDDGERLNFLDYVKERHAEIL